MIIEDDYVIEHFGVKGQKWGVRKSKSSSSGKPLTNKQKKQLTYEQRQKRIKITSAVLAGGVFAAKILADSHNAKVQESLARKSFQAQIGRQQQALNIIKIAGAHPQRSQNAEKWLRQNKLINETTLNSVMNIGGG